MKSKTLFILALGFGLISGLSSCVDGTDDIGGKGNGNNGGGSGSKKDPVITIESEPDKFIRAGDSVSYELVLESNSQLTSLKELRFELLEGIGNNFNALPSYSRTFDKAGIPSSGERFGFLIESTFSSGDTLKAKFTLENANGASTTKERMLIVSELMDDRVISGAEDSTIIIQHRLIDDPNQPKNEFSLDYSANEYNMGYVTSGQGEEADIADDSQTDSTFAKRWKSKTSTMFVKANEADLNFTYPIDVKVEGAYKAGSPAKVVENIEEDDIIIANVRDEDKYVVIQIQRVFDSPEKATAKYIQFKATGKNLFP